MGEFTHVDDEHTSMVGVGDKPDVRREATAAGRIDLREATVEALAEGQAGTDDVYATARVAAVQAVKRTWDDIPMCHQLPITDVSVQFEVQSGGVEARVTVVSTGKTGVEMEALNGATRALLTLWDMLKASEKDDQGQYPATTLSEVRVVEKRVADPEA